MTPLEEALATAETMVLLGAVDPELQERAQKVSMLVAARWYALEVGWYVFPLRPGDKKPLLRSAHEDVMEQKRCAGRCGQDGHGLYDATRDPEVITRWWTASPNAGIGTPTGLTMRGEERIGCGYDVVDIDPPDGIHHYLKARHSQCPPGCSDETFCAATGPLPPIQGIAHTPRGGLHLFVAPSGLGNTSNEEIHIDTRCNGGYVALPPSRRVDGPSYTWLCRPPSTP